MIGDKWGVEKLERFRVLWPLYEGRQRKIARELGLTPGQVAGMARRLRLHSTSRAGVGKVLATDNPAVLEARTIYPHSVRGPEQGMLKSGDNSPKLGTVVQKGAWKGYPIYSLTLEERATCPRSCQQWRSCFGNGMNWAARYDRGERFEIQLWRDLTKLQAKHPGGFVVRLHVLGDFYSTSYVDLWEAALDQFPALRVFGYTHWQRHTPIGAAIVVLRELLWDRFAVRTSDAQSGPRTIVVGAPDAAGSAIVCPAQTGRTSCCGTCGLCWSPAARERVIAFVRH